MGTFVSEILFYLYEFGQLLPRPFETPYQHIRRIRSVPYKRYYDTIYQLEKRGVVKTAKRNGKAYIQLTRKGKIETLLAKAALKESAAWDGKWRLLIFDIPETASGQRDLLRYLLKKNKFYKLQASVFISPYPFNREAVAYLKESGLTEYIRLLRVDEIDDDKKLRKYFNL